MKKYDFIDDFEQELAIVKLNNKWGVINIEGLEIVPLIYDSVGMFYTGFAKVKLNDKYGFIDKQGKEVISLIYDSVDNFKEGLARITLNGKWGYINELGEKVIPLIYDNLYHFNEEYYHGRIDNKHYLIDTNTFIPIECNYQVYENIGSRKDNLEVFYTDDFNIVLFSIWCFNGNSKELKEYLADTYNNEDNVQCYQEYMDIIKEYER